MDRNQQEESGGETSRGGIDFRHFRTFQEVYRERHYANGGRAFAANRKSVVRMIQNLERHFECDFFHEDSRGDLTPSPFAERLNNDLRFLNQARERLEDHIARVHENGRVLRVGSSPAAFRTAEFRGIFRRLQGAERVRAAFTPMDVTDPQKMLISGHCDLYIGSRPPEVARFDCREVGAISYKCYVRAKSAEESQSSNAGAKEYVVALDGVCPNIDSRTGKVIKLADSQWVYWCDHPRECPVGTLIHGPEIEMDSDYWQEIEKTDGQPAVAIPLYLAFLRQHSYEFLPALAASINPSPNQS